MIEKIAYTFIILFLFQLGMGAELTDRIMLGMGYLIGFLGFLFIIEIIAITGYKKIKQLRSVGKDK